jgi:hypothetical protein
MIIAVMPVCQFAELFGRTKRWRDLKGSPTSGRPEFREKLI